VIFHFSVSHRKQAICSAVLFGARNRRRHFFTMTSQPSDSPG
jgi:hypothetical protein